MTKPLTADDPILGPARTTFAQAKRAVYPYIVSTTTPNVEATGQYLTEVYRLAPLIGIDPTIVVAQGALETSNWTSEAWVKRRNPAGIGILGDPNKPSEDLGYRWDNGVDAARGQIAHLMAYVLGANGRFPSEAIADRVDLLYPWSYDPRWHVVIDKGLGKTVTTIQDLSGKWATVADYGSRIARRGNELFQFQEEAAMYPTYPVLMDAKTGRTIQVESPVPIVQKLIPLSKSWIRPGIPLRSPWGWIQHETGNPNAGANAEMHYRYLMGLPQGTNVSFHFVVDDTQILQLVPCNEVTWQAADGNGPGNYACVSCELCINSDGNKALSRRNAEWLCGGVLKANDGTVADVGRHWDYNWGECCDKPCDVQCGDRHHCPDHMMSEGYWPTFVTNAGKVIAGGGPAPVPTPGITYPAHLDAGIAKRMFGKVKGEDGKSYEYVEGQSISSLWLARYGDYGWPAVKEVWSYDGGARRYVRFLGGPVLFIGTDGVPSVME